MKKITIISGAVFSGLTIMSLLFKLMHWPGANVGLTLGLAGLVMVFIPFFAVYQYRRQS